MLDRLAQFKNALAEHHVPAVAELRARPVLDQSGQPHVVAGNNAMVARLRRADGADVALRIVASAGKDRDWPVRYTALAQFQETRSLARVPSAIRLVRQGLPSFEPAIGDDNGSTVGIAMEWIQGPTLMQGIDRAARTGNVSVIRALSAAYVQMWNELQATGIVHGDITADNLLVRANGQLACVDLDGASWEGSPLGSAGEGSPAYRHSTLFRDAGLRDVYASLVIVTSLAVLADEPALRKRHGDPIDHLNGGLVFSSWDLADPALSQTFADAEAHASDGTNLLLGALAAASRDERAEDVLAAASQIPRLRLPANLNTKEDSVAAAWDLAPVIARMRAHYGDTWKSDPDQPVVTDEVPKRKEATTPAADGAWLTWQVPDAEQEAAVTAGDIDELDMALERGDEAEVVRIWSQIGHDPLAALLAGDVETVIAAGYDRRVIEESRRKRDAAVVAVAAEAARRRIPPGPQVRSIVRQAQERIEVQARLDLALQNGDRQQLADLAVSGQLVVLGDTDRRSLQRVLQAIEWPALERAIQTDDDVLIAAAFDEDLFGDDSFLEADVRDRIDLARTRIRWLVQVRDALARRQVGNMRELMFDPPEGGPERLSGPERRRVRRAIEQQQALADLAKVIGASDDQAIISALNRVERVGARISDRATWSQIQRVVERVAVIEDLQEASSARPLDYARIAQLLPAVKALGLERDPRLGDEGLIERLEDALIRMAHARRIQAAIARDNDLAIVTAAVPDSRHALELLSDAERDRVAAAVAATRGPSRPAAS